MEGNFFSRFHIDGLGLVSIALILFMLSNVIGDMFGESFLHDVAPQGNSATDNAIETQDLPSPTPPPLPSGVFPLSSDKQEAIAPPYDQYYLTQGPHGFEYGHMAIDISSGEGADVLSPINGFVTALFVDDLGNTWLILENDIYQVTLLHGLFTVQEGQQVRLGEVIGVESNQGNTFDAQGRSCRGRDCGYHTHLNILDKRLNANVNPLDLFIDNPPL
jgi:murein DD-endopeptidase MepM/ murein hydrolase activator NlpD